MLGLLHGMAGGQYMVMSSEGPIVSLHVDEPAGTIWPFLWTRHPEVCPLCLVLHTSDGSTAYRGMPEPGVAGWDAQWARRFEEDVRLLEVSGSAGDAFRLASIAEVHALSHEWLRRLGRSAH